MSHTIREKNKLLARVRRIRGQIEAIERALEEEAGCGTVMHLIAGVRGATSGLMNEVLEDHVRTHLIDAGRGSRAQGGDAAAELIDVLRTYLK
jgi:FrmR/RcnR family transcriptional regulator, repressor of frmRAB operon